MAALTAPLDGALKAIAGRAGDDGAFAPRPGAAGTSDATAWAVMALSAAHAEPERVARARARLVAMQGTDGRVSADPANPQAWWVTPLAVLAWYGAKEQEEAQLRAVAFLEREGGKSSERGNKPIGHDPSIPGWSWIEGSASMVEPTALGLLALRRCGESGHPRAKDAVRLLLDRQLPSGGWNYGNTVIYDRVLLPQVDASGVALLALAGLVARAQVEGSIGYLRAELARVRAPLSLGFGLLALRAWGEKPADAAAWIDEASRRQEQRGGYGTPLLGLLVLAALEDAGVARLVDLEVPK